MLLATISRALILQFPGTWPGMTRPTSKSAWISTQEPIVPAWRRVWAWIFPACGSCLGMINSISCAWITFATILLLFHPSIGYSQVAEMAAFEWAQGMVFDARDAQHLAAMAPGQWPDMHFSFTPALQRLDLEWNIPLLWAALDREDDALPELEQQPCPVGWLLWR